MKQGDYKVFFLGSRFLGKGVIYLKLASGENFFPEAKTFFSKSAKIQLHLIYVRCPMKSL